MEDNIELTEIKLNDLVTVIKENTSSLLKENHSNQSLIQSATSRGFQILKGVHNKQLYIDMCAIALTLYLQNEEK